MNADVNHRNFYLDGDTTMVSRASQRIMMLLHLIMVVTGAASKSASALSDARGGFGTLEAL